MSTQKQVVVAHFPEEGGAYGALRAVKSKDLKNGSAAILSKSEDGKIRVKDIDDWGAGRGAAAGALAGAVLPIVGWTAGAIVGAMAAKINDGGFPDTKLKAMAHDLAPDSSILLLLTDSELIPVLEMIFAEFDGRLEINYELSEELSKTIFEALEEDLGHLMKEEQPST